MGNRFGKCVRRSATAVLLAAGLVSAAANATPILVAEPDGVVLDTNTHLEWQQIANNGPFNWANAGGGSTTTGYANTLTLDGGGFHLATISELQGLYNDLRADGVCAGGDCTGNKGGFTGIQSVYWSGTEVNSSIARFFIFQDGGQSSIDKSLELSAWAVRPGDVDVAAAPEPASLLLIGAGMLGLGWSRRRGRRR